MQEFTGKVAFVTGGNSGIGLGIVKVLAAQGMKVAFTYRRADHLEQAMAYFRQHPELSVHPVALDVTDRVAFARVADEIERSIGPVQVLVNNAGVGIHGPIAKASYDDWDWVLGVNLGGVVNGIVTFLPRMVARDLDGHIVNVSSMGGVAALGTVGLYSTSKFAVVGMTESLRTDLIGSRIGASVYCPGPVKSNIGDGEKGRPASLSRSGYEAGPQQGAPPQAMLDTAMEAEEAGRYVLEGIRRNELFIFSHPEFRYALASRHAALMAALPDEPFNQPRADAIRWILSNAIYDEGA